MTDDALNSETLEEFAGKLGPRHPIRVQYEWLRSRVVELNELKRQMVQLRNAAHNLVLKVERIPTAKLQPEIAAVLRLLNPQNGQD